jgi:hypothetical protein
MTFLPSVGIVEAGLFRDPSTLPRLVAGRSRSALCFFRSFVDRNDLLFSMMADTCGTASGCPAPGSFLDRDPLHDLRLFTMKKRLRP